MNRITRDNRERPAVGPELHIPLRFEMHLDARFGVIPEHDMTKIVYRHGTAEFAIDTVQQIEIERRCDSLRVVVGR